MKEGVGCHGDGFHGYSLMLLFMFTLLVVMVTIGLLVAKSVFEIRTSRLVVLRTTKLRDLVVRT